MKNNTIRIALILFIIMTIASLGSLVMTIVQAVESGFSAIVAREIKDILVSELIVFLLYLGIKRDTCKR